MKRIFKQKVLGNKFPSVEVDCANCSSSGHPDDRHSFCPVKGYGKGECRIDKEIRIKFSILSDDFAFSNFFKYSHSVVDVNDAKTDEDVKEYVYEVSLRNMVGGIAAAFISDGNKK